MHKRGGLGPDPVSRRALASHIATYTLAFVPALIWIGLNIGAPAAIGLALLIAIPHWIQDDGRPVRAYMRKVKRTNPDLADVALYVDQSLHLVVLFAIALLAGA
jgi:hypothetical protein